MRENIGLYKAKREDNDEWVEGCLSVLNDECMIAIGYRNHNELDNPHCMWVDVDKDTVSQFTGLKDKHGKMIFENDIVTMSNENYVIVWETDGNHKDYKIQGFGCNHIKGYMGNIPLGTKQNEILEIIGNKFDNPELLKKE